MILKTDCLHFPGDRPCKFNKESGQICTDCPHYKKNGIKILVIKLDAVGDVLRSTCLLPSLKTQYPESVIYWVTKQNAVDLFRNINSVKYVLPFESNETLIRLLNQKFDILIHPDANPVSGGLASLVHAEEKFGFVLNEYGVVQPLSPAAEAWLEMGAFDEKKKNNKKTYQEVIHAISGLPYNKAEIQLELNEEEKLFRDKFSEKHNLSRFNKIIGLNTGASARWRLKQWHQHHLESLIEMYKGDSTIGILLYGGPEEAERNAILENKFPFIINTGTDNTLRRFFSLLDLSDVVITGDTLGLHAATALRKKVICLFGPTSSAEIEDYSRIYKVVPEMDCLVCYKPECDFVPNCMDLISPQKIFTLVNSII